MARYMMYEGLNALTQKRYVRTNQPSDIRYQISDTGVVWNEGIIAISGGTLLWDNRRLIGRSLIVLARKVQNNRD